MDIVSHGLWGSLAFGRRSRHSFWLAFFFGVAPDLFSFGLFFGARILGLASGPDWSHGTPDPSLIPPYVHSLYNITHSLIVAGLAFVIVWLFRKRPLWEMLGWPLHILFDIPTHASKFFATPFLWPLSDYRINGIPWISPQIFIPNVLFLIVLYTWFFIRQKRRAK